jgi:hypothetical protein
MVQPTTATGNPIRPREAAPPPAPAPLPSEPKDDAAPVYLKQDGKVYLVRDWATLQRWIMERRVGREDLVSEGGVRWEPVGSRADLGTFFAAIEQPSEADDARVGPGSRALPFEDGADTSSGPDAWSPGGDDLTDGVPLGLPPLPTDERPTTPPRWMDALATPAPAPVAAPKAAPPASPVVAPAAPVAPPTPAPDVAPPALITPPATPLRESTAVDLAFASATPTGAPTSPAPLSSPTYYDLEPIEFEEAPVTSGAFNPPPEMEPMSFGGYDELELPPLPRAMGIEEPSPAITRPTATASPSDVTEPVAPQRATSSLPPEAPTEPHAPARAISLPPGESSSEGFDEHFTDDDWPVVVKPSPLPYVLGAAALVLVLGIGGWWWTTRAPTAPPPTTAATAPAPAPKPIPAPAPPPTPPEPTPAATEPAMPAPGPAAAPAATAPAATAPAATAPATTAPAAPAAAAPVPAAPAPTTTAKAPAPAPAPPPKPAGPPPAPATVKAPAPAPAPAAAPAPTGDATALINKGWAAIDSGKVSDAERLFKSALAAAPGSAAAAYGYGYALIEAGRADEAAQYLCRALSNNPSTEDRREIEGVLRSKSLTCP